jgi:hypothetical protein
MMPGQLQGQYISLEAETICVTYRFMVNNNLPKSYDLPVLRSRSTLSANCTPSTVASLSLRVLDIKIDY